MIQLTQIHLAMIVISAAALAFGIGIINGVLLFDWLNTRYEKNKKEYLNAPIPKTTTTTINARREVSASLKAIK